MVGQKKYHFDYVFSVNEIYVEKKMNFNSVFLVNSKYNDYRLYTHENKDTLAYTLHFIDEKGLSFYGSMSKNNFNKVETIVNTCNEVFRFRNPYKTKKTNCYFINYSDTIIDDISYFHYAIKSNKKLSYQKRKKIVTMHFIVDKTDTSFLPFTYYSFLYETWKNSKNIPNGYPKTIYSINTEGIETGRMEFTVSKVDKFTTIPNECDFTRKDLEDNLPKILKKAKFSSDYPSINY